MMAPHQPATRPHGRHHFAPHHHGLGILAIAVGLALVLALVLGARHAALQHQFHPPKQSLSSDSTKAAAGVASDFTQIQPGDLADDLLPAGQ